MKLLNKFMIAGMIAIPLVFAGCSSAPKAEAELTPEQKKFEEEKKNIIIDEELKEDIKIERLRTWKSEHGLVKVFVRARVRVTGCFEWIFYSYKTLTLKYRFAWYDENGVEVETPSSKKWMILNAQYDEEIGFNSSSPNEKIKDYKLFIKKVTEEKKDDSQKKDSEKKAAASKDESKKDPQKETSGKDVKVPPAAPAQAKPEQKDKKAGKGTVAEDVKVPPTTPTQAKPEQKNKKAGKGTVAEDVKVPPSTPTQAKPVKKNDEAEADAAAIRQATPAKPANKKETK